MSDACIFCKIARGEIPADTVDETPDTLTILDRFPAAPGHMLVILKNHREFLTDCTDDETARLFQSVRRSAAALGKTLGSPAMNILNNNHPDAGQRIPHVHVHLIPRAEGDGLKLEAPQHEVSDADRADMADRIRKAFV